MIYSMNRIIICVFYIFMLNSFNLVSQESDHGFWKVYNANANIDNKFAVFLDYQIRNYDYFSDLNQIMIRHALTYKINKKIELGQGYAYVYHRFYDNMQDIYTFDEHRIFQQFLLNLSTDKIAFVNRYRFEERILPDEFSFRVRAFLSLNISLYKDLLEKNNFYFSMYDELFFDENNHNFLDQNRFYMGFGFVFLDGLRAEIANMWQSFMGINTSQYLLSINHNFDLF